MYYVVLLNSDPKNEKCPLGLIAQAMYGDGISVYRCYKDKNHRGPHESIVGSSDRSRVIHVRIQWAVGKDVCALVNWETGQERS